MRAFRCPHCGFAVAFEQQSCFACSTEVAFYRPWMAVALAPAAGESTMIDDAAWVRCANWDRGCNWLVEADSKTPICFAEGFVRNEPGPDDTAALKELASTLKDLRRLIFQLLDLGLPITPFRQDPKGLAFDLISSESVGHPVTIGHADGVITIDLAESLELYRERQRIILKEPYRTMLGHLRHEVGHYYEMILITGGELIDQTRAFFGDERRNYQAALADYYAGVLPDGWEHDYISHYATAHPRGRLGGDVRPLSAHHRHPGGRRGLGANAVCQSGALRPRRRHQPSGALWRRRLRRHAARLGGALGRPEPGEPRHGQGGAVSLPAHPAGGGQAQLRPPRAHHRSTGQQGDRV
jgi:hypothetical protein